MSLTDQFVDAIAEAVARRLEGKIEHQSTPGRRLLTVDEAGEYLGYTPAAVRHMVAKGQLPCVHIGRSIRFDVRDLDSWIDENKR